MAGYPKEFIAVDIMDCPVASIAAAAVEAGVQYRFIKADDLQVELPEHDVLFIDTYHRYEHLKAELDRFHGQCRGYIAMHDTETYGEFGQDSPWGGVCQQAKGLRQAIAEFLAEHPEWRMYKVFTNCNGLTILERAK
jgi:cephalosporin hydroxylase